MNITETSSITLQVTWNPPLKAQSHGVIRQYNIRYRQVECATDLTNSANGTNLTNETNERNETNLESWINVTVNGSTTSTELTNLTKWSCYKVQIRAATVKSGVWSDIKQHRTSEDGKRICSCI